jgi:hypothetical protein
MSAVLRPCSSTFTSPELSVAITLADGRGNLFTIVAASVAALSGTTRLAHRFTTSYPGLDTGHTLFILILVIVVVCLRLRGEPVIPVTVVLAAVGAVSPAARRRARGTGQLPGPAS